MSEQEDTENIVLLKPLLLSVFGNSALFHWRVHFKFMKEEKKGKMSSKSDSFEYMNNLVHQKIWGP